MDFSASPSSSKAYASSTDNDPILNHCFPNPHIAIINRFILISMTQLILVNVKPVVGSTKSQKIPLRREVQTKTALTQTTQSSQQPVLLGIRWRLRVNPDLAVRTSRPGSKYLRISLTEASSVNILGVIDITCSPIDLLHLFESLDVPKLKLLLRCITSSQNPSALIVQGLSGYIRAVEVLYAPGLPHIPNMNYTIPPSRYDGMLVDILDREDSIIMSDVVPASRLKIMYHRLGLLILRKLPSS